MVTKMFTFAQFIHLKLRLSCISVLSVFRREFVVSVIDQTQESGDEKVMAELFASETQVSNGFRPETRLSIHATRSSRASPGKPRMIRRKEHNACHPIHPFFPNSAGNAGRVGCSVRANWNLHYHSSASAARI